jgi:methyltransferase (TIGR00027 family)
MDFIALFIFMVVQILFLPLSISGFILVAYKQMYVSKRLGVSGSAIEVINGRWTLDVFGIRKDTATVKLNRVLPNNSLPGMWMFLFPSYLRYKISGKNVGYPSIAKPGEEGVLSLFMNRTIYFDNIINKSKDKVDQFVVMGAGFDTRCYGDLKNSHLKFFELDQTKTQKLKKEYLKRAGIDTSPVTYVEVDFRTEHWYEKLEKAGYDPGKKSIFLWEGVTLYLSEKEVRNTLKEMKAHAGSGSIIVADLYAKSFVTGEYAPGMKKAIKLPKITDEELGFGIDFSSDDENALKTFLESEDMKGGDTYFMGSKTKKGTYMVVVEINLY